ncbi:MAG: hypothetical protein HYX39_03585 [Bacteroidetes bacterium]|nr:hypothetical protein [Bacteroidota bacterium]
MKYKFKLLLILSTLSFVSCKKNRICECKNANSTYTAGEIYGTRSQAKKACNNLSNANTECYLK